MQLHDSKLDILGFVVSSQGIHVNKEKVSAIRDWSTPKSATEVRSVHVLATFYRYFIRNFNSLVAPMTNCLKKKGAFVWTNEAERALNLLRKSLPMPLS